MVSMKGLLALGVLFLASVSAVKACNEAICGPLVSKCMLIKCCDCEMADLKNCTCCRECQICLSKLYTECCSCVGMCSPPDIDDELEKSSSVEDLKDPIPALFNVLTEEEDIHQRWSTFTYAVDLDKLFSIGSGSKRPEKKTKVIKDRDDIYNTVNENTQSKPMSGIQNCTVAFFSDCMPIGKCKASCKSMGANKYRWFHEHGCCQCIGNTCFDYGLSEPKCLKCPEQSEITLGDQPYSWAENVKTMYQADAVLDTA